MGERSGEGEFVGEFLLESIEEAIGGAYLRGYILSVVGGHAYQAHWVHDEFLHQE